MPGCRLMGKDQREHPRFHYINRINNMNFKTLRNLLTLFHRPTIRAPNKSEPWEGVRPLTLRGLLVRNWLNSGTSCFS